VPGTHVACRGCVLYRQYSPCIPDHNVNSAIHQADILFLRR